MIYNMELEAVEPVFYAVVPDSFMNRESAGEARQLPEGGSEWTEASEAVFIAPHDAWSF
jgi:hypothetical protein